MPPPPYIATMQQHILELQGLVIGNPSIPNSGLNSRVRELELGDQYTRESLKEIKSDLRRVAWLMIGSIIVALMNLIIPRTYPAHSGATQTTSIQTSAASPKGIAAASQRDYLTVADVSEREDKAARTIQLWASEGRISGASKDAGGDWIFPKDYRILPQNGVPLPQITAASVKPDSSAAKP